MARGRKKEYKPNTSKPKNPQTAGKQVEFKRALVNYRRKYIEKAHLMMDKEAVMLFVKKRMPSLEASQENWDELFKKF